LNLCRGDFPLLQNIHNGSGESSPELKRLRHYAGHLPTFITEVKNEWSYTSTPLICLLGVDRDSFTFTFILCVISHLLV